MKVSNIDLRRISILSVLLIFVSCSPEIKEKKEVQNGRLLLIRTTEPFNEKDSFMEVVHANGQIDKKPLNGLSSSDILQVVAKILNTFRGEGYDLINTTSVSDGLRIFNTYFLKEKYSMSYSE